MISPCSCRGSLRFVHSGCLQHWFDVMHTKVCLILPAAAFSAIFDESFSNFKFSAIQHQLPKDRCFSIIVHALCRCSKGSTLRTRICISAR